MKKVATYRRAVCLVVTAVMLLLCTGCFNKDEGPTKEELESMNLSYAEQVNDLTEQVETLQATLDKLTGKTETIPGAIYDIPSGEGRTFSNLGGSITLPVPVQYPGSEASPASNKVMLDAMYSIYPTENWTIVLNGTASTFCHNSGITVNFQIAKTGDRVEATALKEQMFDPIIAEIPCENAHYGSIFYNEYALGGTVSFTTSVNEQPAQMRIGAFGDNSRCFTFVTMYEGEVDSTKEELINKLLSSLEYGSNKLVLS